MLKSQQIVVKFQLYYVLKDYTITKLNGIKKATRYKVCGMVCYGKEVIYFYVLIKLHTYPIYINFVTFSILLFLYMRMYINTAASYIRSMYVYHEMIINDFL